MSEYPQPPEESKPTETAEERDRRLNREFSELFTEYIATKWKTVLCPICGSGSWTSKNAIKTPFWFGPERVHVFVPVVCTTCAYTMFFDTLMAGIMDSQGNPVPLPEEAPPEEPEEES